MTNFPTEPDRSPLFPVEEMEAGTDELRMPATSDTDMTGLIPNGITNAADIDNYNDIYPYLAPYVDNDQI